MELLKSCTVPEEGTAQLTCRVKGLPRPTIKWFKEGKELQPGANLQLDYAEDGRVTLTIPKALMGDSGEFRCFAENELGNAWTEGPIVVTAKGAVQPEGRAPDFAEPIRPVTVDVGADATFQGKVSGEPFPEIRWFQAGKEISKADNRFKQEAAPDGTVKLIVLKAQEQDAGEFRCIASNKFGDAGSDTQLIVKGECWGAGLMFAIRVFYKI